MERKDTDAGWTFLETLIVMGIVMILTGSVGLMGARYVEKAKRISARATIETLSTALDAYYFDCRRYPTIEQGLGALWQKPILAPIPDRWDGPYVNRMISADPWGNDYLYIVPGPSGLPFGLLSRGADAKRGGSGEAGDIASWQE